LLLTNLIVFDSLNSYRYFQKQFGILPKDYVKNLSTQTIWPFCTLMPPLERKYGGSAKMQLNLKLNCRSNSRQSPC